MSRRSLLTPDATLLRSARRGVPTAQMWSEAPVPPQVAWDGYEQEPAVGFDPQWMMWVPCTSSGGGAGSGGLQKNLEIAANSMFEGTRILAKVMWREAASVVLHPSWTVLGRYELGSSGVAWLTKVYSGNSLKVAEWNISGASWSSGDVVAWAFEKDVVIEVDNPRKGVGNPMWLSQPSRPKEKYRFRFLTGHGFYAWFDWSDPPGLDQGAAGYIHIGWSSNGSINENPVAPGFPEHDPHRALTPWATKPWWSGSAQHGTIGVAGSLTWIESHVYVKGI